MPVHVSRNFFGAQIASFEQQLPVHQCLAEFGGEATYRAVFIRAPAILSVDESRVTVLSKYTLSESEKARSGREDVIVAARCQNMLATAFHPELTDDCRWCAPTTLSAACMHSLTWPAWCLFEDRGQSKISRRYAGINYSSA
jgi:pyridoxal 5'-phosphate synthase pdxT subunit